MPSLDHGVVLRPSELRVLPGGKGVNAARAAVCLGAEVVTTGIAGGHAGRWLVEALEREGLEPRFATAAAESRTTYVTVDALGASVLVYQRPPVATTEEYARFLSLLTDELLPACDRAIVAGSVPAGLESDDHGGIVEVARAVGCPLLVDASGPGLLAAVAGRADIVKVGRIEAVEAGLASASDDAATVAAAIVEAGAALAIVTDGPLAVHAATLATTFAASVPEVEVVNAVGSGDAFNAGLSIALAHGDVLADALAAGVAAGAANAMTLSAGDLDAAVARELRGRVTVSSERR